MYNIFFFNFQLWIIIKVLGSSRQLGQFFVALQYIPSSSSSLAGFSSEGEVVLLIFS